MLNDYLRLYNRYKDYLYIPIKNNAEYHIKSPQEFEQQQGGICYDYVVAIANQLEKEGIPYHCYYTVIHKGEKTIATHTYIIIDSSPKVWLECSWKSKRGLYVIDSPKDIEDLLLYHYNGDNAFTVEYNPLETVGMSLNDFYSYLENKTIKE